MTDRADPFASCRSRLLGLAYRMLGSRAEAEDVVQDAYLRFERVDPEEIRDTEAFLVTTVTRLCLDELKSARARREVYVGPWLPEPVLDAEALSPESATELAEDLSFALMLILEKMSAPERAAFLLHDVFDTPYAQIAETLGKSQMACRQLAARARKAIKGARPQRPAPRESHEALLHRFVEAVSTGDQEGLSALLAADAVAYSDGGGLKTAALRPIRGPDRISRFFTGLAGKLRARGASAELVAAMINGAPGFVVYLDGELDQTLSIEVDADRISRVYIVRNPEKLGAVGAVLH